MTEVSVETCFVNLGVLSFSLKPNRVFSLVSGWEQCSVVCVVKTRMGIVYKETVTLRQGEIDEQELLSLSTEVLII